MLSGNQRVRFDTRKGQFRTHVSSQPQPDTCLLTRVWWQNDLAMLLSSFTEMGLKIRMDVSDDAMQVAGFFFRRAAPPKESRVSGRGCRGQSQAARWHGYRSPGVVTA